MAIKIFVSAGTPADEAQRAFRDKVVNTIQLTGLSPRLMSDKDWDYKNPIRGVCRAMDECHGAVVIAYARYRFAAGIELRKDGAHPIQDTLFPTAWNQIEAAMAYERGFPLLVVAQNGLCRDAFLESTGDTMPFWHDLDSRIVDSEGFRAYVLSWKQDVEAFAAVAQVGKRQSTSSETTIKQLIASVPWYEMIALIGTIVGALLAAAAIGYRAGSGQWPLG